MFDTNYFYYTKQSLQWYKKEFLQENATDSAILWKLSWKILFYTKNILCTTLFITLTNEKLMNHKPIRRKHQQHHD